MTAKSDDLAPYRWKDVRVFISSTFRDFHAERDYLVKFVFPELRQWCERYRLHLTDIDLRWGVTVAQAESGKVIDLCLEQVDGSRPFFICMLGNRYGWVPERNDIPHETLSHYDQLLEPEKTGYSITHMEIHHAVLQPLSTADKFEEVPSAFFYFRSEKSVPKPEEIIFWSETERNEFKKAFYDQDQSLAAWLKRLKEEIREHYLPDEADKRIFHYSPVFEPSLNNPEDDALKGRFTADSLREFGNRVLEDLKKSISLRFGERIARLTEKHREETPESELDLHERFVETRTRGFTGRTALLRKIKEYVEGDSTGILAVYGEAGSGKSSLLGQFYRTYKYDNGGNNILGDTLFIPHFMGASPGSTALYNLLRRICAEIKRKFTLEKEIPAENNKLPETFLEFLEQAPGKVILLIDGLNQLDESGESTGLGWLPSGLGKNVKIIVSALPGKTEKTLRQKTDSCLTLTPLSDGERREIIKRIPSLFAKTLNEELVAVLLKREETSNPLYLKVALEELRIFGGFGRSGEKLEEYVNDFPSDVVDMFAFVLQRLEQDHSLKQGLVQKLFCLIESSRFGLTLGELQELLPEDTDKTHRVILRQVRDYLLNRAETIDFFHRGLSKAVRKKYGLDEKAVAEPWHRILSGYFMDKPIFRDGGKRREPQVRKLAEQPFQQTACRMWNEATATLCDLWFVEAKVRAGMVYDLQEDYENVLREMPEAYEELERGKREKQRAWRWIREIIDYSSHWNDSRGIVGGKKGSSPKCKTTNARFPEKMPAVIPDTEKDAAADVSGIKDNLTGLMKLKIFRHFLRVKLSPLVRYGRTAGFVIQEAYNFAKDGPIGSSAAEAIAGMKGLICLLNHDGLRPEYNPRPAVKRDLVEPTPYRAQVIFISPDGLNVVSGGYPVRAWNTDAGAVTITFKDHQLITTKLAVTPDARFLLLPKDLECVRLWDLKKGTILSTFGDDSSENWDNAVIGMTPDGRLAYLTEMPKKTVQILDMRKGLGLKKLKLRRETGKEFGFTADGKYLFCSAREPDRPASFLYVIDTQSGKSAKIMTGIPIIIDKLAVTMDGAYAAVSGWRFAGREGHKETRILVYDLWEKTLNADFSGAAPTLRVIKLTDRALKITEDGRLVFFIGSGDSLKIWDVEKKALVRELTGYAEMLSLDITPDGSLAVTGDADSHLRLWDVAHGLQFKSEFIYKGKVNDIAASGNGVAIALAGDDGSIKILDRESGQVSVEIAAHKKGVTQCAFVPGSGLLLSGSFDRSVQLHDPATGRLLHAYRFADRKIRKSEILPDGSRYHVGDSSVSTCNLFVTPDSRRAVYNECGANRVVRMIDLKTGDMIGTLRDIEDKIIGLNLSAEGRLFYSTDANNVQMIDLVKGIVLKRFIGHKNDINSLAVTPDGRMAITGSGSNTNDDNSVRTWDIVRGEIVAELASLANNVSQVTVSPDGRRIIAGGGGHLAYFVGDNTIRIWDTKSSRLVHTLSGHEHIVHKIRVTPDANYVITSSFDDTIRVWNLATGECLALFCGGKGWSSDYVMSDLFRNGEFCYWNPLGKFMMLKPLNLNSGPQVATAIRLWRYLYPPAEGNWDEQITALCCGCGRRFAVSGQVLSVIEGILRNSGIKKDASPLLQLDAEAWNEKGLLSACPHCGNPIKFNPFANDARKLPEIFEQKPSGIYKKEKKIRLPIPEDSGNSRARLTELNEI